MEEEIAVLLKKMIDIVDEISAMSDFRCVVKRQCRDLSRRLKLLTPLFEELVGIREQICDEETVKALILLKETLESAKELLEICSRGSKILLVRNRIPYCDFCVLQSEKIWNKCQQLAVQFEPALSFVSVNKLDVPDELKEQVELACAQFRRVKERINAPDLPLYKDLLSYYNCCSDMETKSGLTSILCEKLELMSIEHLREESRTLDEKVASGSWDVEQTREKIQLIMKKFEDYVMIESTKNSIPVCENCSGCDQACTNQSRKSPVVPDDFRCPISLELMKDPVVICTGQTYERACIRKWLEAGHGTCPKTQQKLFSSTLTPNYALSSVIAHWCEANAVEVPKRSGNSRPGKTSSWSIEGVDIDALLSKLTSGDIEDQRASAGLQCDMLKIS